MQSAFETFAGTNDTDIVPHEAAQFIPVVREDDFLVGIADSTIVPTGHLWRLDRLLAENVPGRRLAEYDTLQKRIARQSVGAMETGAGGFTECIEPRQVGPGLQVHDNAAAGVMRCRYYRDGLMSDIDAQFTATGLNVGEVGAQEAFALMRHVEEDAIEAVLLHLEVDGTGYHIARRQFGTRIVIGHEARAVRQAQDAALAAHRFGNQEGLGVRVVEAGRVELNELHVGDAAAGAPGHGDAVAGCRVRIGRVEIDLAGTARGDNGVGRGDGYDFVVVDVENVGAPAAIGLEAELCAGDQVDDDVSLEHRDVRVRAYLLIECLLHGGAGGIGDVDDTPVAVAAFACQVVARAAARKRHALCDQPIDRLASVFDHESRRRRVAQSGASSECVLDVCFDGVGIVEYGCDAALRPGRGRIFNGTLRDHGDLAMVRQAKRDRLAGKAAAKHHYVERLEKVVRHVVAEYSIAGGGLRNY